MVFWMEKNCIGKFGEVMTYLANIQLFQWTVQPMKKFVPKRLFKDTKENLEMLRSKATYTYRNRQFWR